MTRGEFSRLYFVLQTPGGLKDSRNTLLGEQVAMFLSILAHHTKNMIVKLIHKIWSNSKQVLPYVDVTVPRSDQPRYRNMKYHISVNVLVICNINMNFIYVLTWWKGNYYLCDGGYPNGDGFLSPYRGIRYHLKEWGSGASLPRI
ncbi:hypothetical protein ACS0TY_017155 [Phlomoides rotata]